MALTPAKFGRALNFARVNPLPMWTKSQEAEFVFPHALGWSNVFQVDVILTPITPVYGVPFVDLVSRIDSAIGLFSPLETVLSMRSAIHDTLDGLADFVSTRITRSAKDE